MNRAALLLLGDRFIERRARRLQLLGTQARPIKPGDLRGCDLRRGDFRGIPAGRLRLRRDNWNHARLRAFEKQHSGGDDEKNGKGADPLCFEAAKFIIETSYASTAQLQSQFSIGHPRAVRLMKQLEEFKVVGPHEGTKPRKILLGLAELEIIAPRLGKAEEAQQELF